MSTKIYDAYRIKKDKISNIFDTLHQFRDMTAEHVAGDESLLESIHFGTFLWLASQDDAEEQIDRFEDNMSYYYISQYLKECEKSDHCQPPLLTEIKLNCSIFMDSEYWYLKFFGNTRWQWDVIGKLEDKFDFLEDFHYQNSTDPPEKFTFEEFKKRGEKWDNILGDRDNYTNGLLFDLFNEYEFRRLFERRRFSHKSDPYKHLAYKFDKTFTEDKFRG